MRNLILILFLIATQLVFGLVTPLQRSLVDFFNPSLGGGSMLDDGATGAHVGSQSPSHTHASS